MAEAVGKYNLPAALDRAARQRAEPAGDAAMKDDGEDKISGFDRARLAVWWPAVANCLGSSPEARHAVIASTPPARPRIRLARHQLARSAGLRVLRTHDRCGIRSLGSYRRASRSSHYLRMCAQVRLVADQDVARRAAGTTIVLFRGCQQSQVVRVESSAPCRAFHLLSAGDGRPHPSVLLRPQPIRPAGFVLGRQVPGQAADFRRLVRRPIPCGESADRSVAAHRSRQDAVVCGFCAVCRRPRGATSERATGSFSKNSLTGLRSRSISSAGLNRSTATFLGFSIMPALTTRCAAVRVSRSTHPRVDPGETISRPNSPIGSIAPTSATSTVSTIRGRCHSERLVKVTAGFVGM